MVLPEPTGPPMPTRMGRLDFAELLLGVVVVMR